MKDENLNPYYFNDSEVEEIEVIQENCLENCLENFNVITNRFDRKSVSNGLKMMLDMAKEPGNTIEDIIQLLNDLYENY